MELHRIGPRQFQDEYRIYFAVITEGLFTEWSEIQARRFGSDVPAAEREPLGTATAVRSPFVESQG